VKIGHRSEYQRCQEKFHAPENEAHISELVTPVLPFASRAGPPTSFRMAT
jgi:hypothetical protein